MSDVILNEGAISHFLHDPASPLGRHMSRLAGNVKTLAIQHAPHGRTGDLIAGMKVKGPFQDTDALFYLVGTDATHPWRGHEPFNYPILIELGGGKTPQGKDVKSTPFLVPALIQAGFRQGE
jgi:hypothetical protein